MTLKSYAESLYEKSYKIAEVYDEATLNDFLIERVDPSICLSLQKYWATHQHADVINIAFMAQSLLAMQKGPAKPANSNDQAASRKTTKSVPGRSHLLMQSRLDHQRHQHVHPDTARDFLRLLIFTPRLHPTKNWTPLRRH